MSQAGQDKFVLEMMRGEIGTYLEIGASHPIHINNTYLLEKNGWKGVSIEIDPQCKDIWASCRSNPLIIADALTYDYESMLHGIERIDYLQLDIEPNWNTFECMKRIMQYPTRYSIITYETDAYWKPDYVQPSRDILTSLGYVLYKADVLSEFGPFEDWYIDPKKIKV